MQRLQREFRAEVLRALRGEHSPLAPILRKRFPDTGYVCDSLGRLRYFKGDYDERKHEDAYERSAYWMPTFNVATGLITWTPHPKRAKRFQALLPSQQANLSLGTFPWQPSPGRRTRAPRSRTPLLHAIGIWRGSVVVLMRNVIVEETKDTGRSKDVGIGDDSCQVRCFGDVHAEGLGSLPYIKKAERVVWYALTGSGDEVSINLRRFQRSTFYLNADGVGTTTSSSNLTITQVTDFLAGVAHVSTLEQLEEHVNGPVAPLAFEVPVEEDDDPQRPFLLELVEQVKWRRDLDHRELAVGGRSAAVARAERDNTANFFNEPDHVIALIKTEAARMKQELAHEALPQLSVSVRMKARNHLDWGKDPAKEPLQIKVDIVHDTDACSHCGRKGFLRRDDTYETCLRCGNAKLRNVHAGHAYREIKDRDADMNGCSHHTSTPLLSFSRSHLTEIQSTDRTSDAEDPAEVAARRKMKRGNMPVAEWNAAMGGRSARTGSLAEHHRAACTNPQIEKDEAKQMNKDKDKLRAKRFMEEVCYAMRLPNGVWKKAFRWFCRWRNHKDIVVCKTLAMSACIYLSLDLSLDKPPPRMVFSKLQAIRRRSSSGGSSSDGSSSGAPRQKRLRRMDLKAPVPERRRKRRRAPYLRR